MHINAVNVFRAVGMAVLATLVAAPVLAGSSWNTGASIPTAEEGYGSATLGGFNYYFGGFPSSPSVGMNQIYDVATNTWTTGAPMPVPNAELAAVADSGTNCHRASDPTSPGPCLYAVSGRDNPGPLQRYDPGLDTWTLLAPLPVPVGTEHGVAEHGGKIYVAGGRNSSTPCGGAEVSDLQIYNIDSNSWSTGAALPMPLSDSVAVSVGDHLYVFGGCSGGVPQATTLIYDIAMDTWTLGAPLPEAGVIDPSAGRCGNKIHLIGGAFAIGLFTDNHFVYNPVTDSWSASTPIPGGLSGAGTESQAASTAGRIFVVGGGIFGSGGSNPVQNIWSCGGPS
jgi:hypothetical protein